MNERITTKHLIAFLDTYNWKEKKLNSIYVKNDTELHIKNLKMGYPMVTLYQQDPASLIAGDMVKIVQTTAVEVKGDILILGIRGFEVKL